MFITLNRMLDKVNILSSSLRKVVFDKIDHSTITTLAKDQGEVGELAQAFNEIMVRLENNILELKESKDKLQRILTKVGKALASVENFDLLMALILETAVDALGARQGAIFALEDGGYVFRVSFGFNETDRQHSVDELQKYWQLRRWCTTIRLSR